MDVFGCSFGCLTHALAAALQEALSHRQTALSACEQSVANFEVGKRKGAGFLVLSLAMFGSNFRWSVVFVVLQSAGVD